MDNSSSRSLFTGLLIALIMYFYLSGSSLNHDAILVASITCLCAVWWALEPIPIPVTSLLPLALLPLLGILNPSQVAEAYGSPLILLLLGGFLLSTAMESSGTHKHIAMMLVHLFGATNGRRVVFGFMTASAVLSMWISNTATTLMLLPVALAVINLSDDKSISVPLLLGICYAASIGGMGTPIGTPPNLIFMQVYQETQNITVSFLQWMTWAVPVVVIFLPIVGWWLTRKLNSDTYFVLPEKMPWLTNQKRVLWVFILTALAWITRTEPFGGWREWLDLPKANDASVVLLAVVMMFLIPDGRGKKLLDWETANKIPWGILLLFAGGIALAKAFVVTGLADAIAQNLVGLTVLPLMLMLLCICLVVTFLTEVTSNTASTSLLMPVLAVAAVSMDMDPLTLMLPAVLSASCAFMLPVATAPNAIVFGSGKVPIFTMVKTGLVLNITGAFLISSFLAFMM